MLAVVLQPPQPRPVSPLPRLLVRLPLLCGRRQPLLLPPLAAPPHQRLLRRHGGQLLLGRGWQRVTDALQNQRVVQGESGQVSDFLHHNCILTRNVS